MSTDPGPRTKFGLLDLDVISPCTKHERCLLDRLILEDESRRATAAATMASQQPE